MLESSRLPQGSRYRCVQLSIINSYRCAIHAAVGPSLVRNITWSTAMHLSAFPEDFSFFSMYSVLRTYWRRCTDVSHENTYLLTYLRVILIWPFVVNGLSLMALLIVIIIIINEYPEAGHTASISVQHIYYKHELQHKLC